MVPRDDVDPPNALPRGTRLGEFEVRRVLGIGGFGIVYLAFDHALERELAVKEYMPASLAGRTATLQVSVLSQAHAETFALGLRSFVNEARLLARFDHPSLVKVYRYWEQNDTAYMAMPFYDGDNLQRVRQRMVQPPDEAWIRQLLTPLLGALERLHGEAVFHRDISPDNVIVQPDGRPVLLDFGAARRVISDKSMALTAILKPAYAPIEQYAEVGTVKQGPWTDLYALGATVHYLLTGHPPTPATARAVQDDGQPLALQALPGCSPEFLHCVDWMLRPRPAERPQSVAELCAALDGRAQVPAAISGNWARTQWLAPADQVTVVAPPAGVGKPHGPAAAATPGTAPGPTGGAADESTRTDTTAASAAKHAADHAATLEPGLDSVVPSADRPMAAGGAAHLQAQTAGTPARRWPAVAVLGLAGLVAAWFGLRPDSGSSAEAERRASGGALPAASAAGPAAVLASGAAPGLATAGPVAGTTPGAASAALPAALSAPATAPAPSAAFATAPAAMPTQGPSTPVATLLPAPATANAKTLIPASAPVVPAPLRQANVAASKPGALFGSQKPTPTPPAVVTSVPSAPPKLPPPLPAATPSVSPPTNALTSAATALHSPAATAPSTTVPAPVLPTAATAMAEPVKPVPSATPAPPTPAAAPAAPAPVATPATVTTAAAALPSATASHTASAAPAPRPVAQRDAELRVRSRVLGPSERCEGRSLVTFQACVDNQCKQPELREHPECQKLRREQEQLRGGSVRY